VSTLLVEPFYRTCFHIVIPQKMLCINYIISL